MKSEEMEAYQRDAEDRFDNFYEEEFVDEEEDSYYIVEDDFNGSGNGIDYRNQYDGYDGEQVGKLDPNDTTYTIVVNNTNAEDVEVVLFGANESVQPAAGVTIEVAESSHNEVREESKSNPFVISGMKMSVEDTAQFDNVLFLVEKTSSGRTTTHVKQPRNWQSPQNQDKNLIHAMDFTFEVTGKSSIRFTAKPGRTVFTFSVKLRTNIANVLSGRNVAEVNTSPQATGLPQIDMLRLKAPAQTSSPAARPLKKVRVMRTDAGQAKARKMASASEERPLKLRRRLRP